MTTVSRLQDELRASKEELTKVADQIKQLGCRKRALEKKVLDIKSELKLLNERESSVTQYDHDDFPWNKEMMSKLRTVFKIENFRSHQKSAINATMLGVDLLLVMPTGGGKSLCFQLPAVLSSGVTVVVSPLISLMVDQLQALQSLGVHTEIFNGQSDRQDTKRIFAAMSDPNSELKMLYVTPEKLAKSKRLMSQLDKMYRAGRFSRLVIDEVHCCSQWGHDFRPDYKFLGIMKTQYPKTPIIGLTATATSNVLVDVQKILNLEGCFVLRDSFYRPNLRYSVIDSSSKEKVDDIADIIHTKFPNQSGIIYCLTVKDCEDVSRRLTDHNIVCATYHAQLDPQDRIDVQNRWYQNEIKIIVATIAFGMGINKLDLRFVIHYSMSKSVENYYQETGRAGRDGLDAECILFYSFSDTFHVTSMMMTERSGAQNVYRMLQYTLDQVTCRKQIVANHFGDACDAIENGCNKCDNCDFKMNDKIRSEAIKVKAAELIKDILKLLNHASSLDIRMTALKLMDAWFKKGAPKLRSDDVSIPKYRRDICEKLVGHLLVDGYLKEDFHFTPYSTISYIVPGSKSFLDLRDDLVYTFYDTSPGPLKTIKNNIKPPTLARNRINGIKKSNKRKSKDATSTYLDDSSDEESFLKKKPHLTSKKRSPLPHISDSDDDSEFEDFKNVTTTKKPEKRGNSDVITID